MGDKSPRLLVKQSSFGSSGMYATKTHFPRGHDLKGASPIPALATTEPFSPAKHDTVLLRPAHVGRQMYTGSPKPRPFSAVVYKAEEFSDKSTPRSPREGNRKIGFGRSGTLTRDEISNRYDVQRFRHGVKEEMKVTARALEAEGYVVTSPRSQAGTPSASPLKGEEFGFSVRGTSPVSRLQRPQTAPAKTTSMSGTSSDLSLRLPLNTIAAPGSPRSPRGSFGLAASLPRCDTGYDTARHVPEFKATTTREERYSRDYGPWRTSSSDIGVGCLDITKLRPASSPRRNFLEQMTCKIHMASTTPLAQ